MKKAVSLETVRDVRAQRHLRLTPPWGSGSDGGREPGTHEQVTTGWSWGVKMNNLNFTLSRDFTVRTVGGRMNAPHAPSLALTCVLFPRY